jgi:hypothetical protein
MKKTLSIIMMILIGGLFMFTSCDDDDTVDPGTTPSAILKGNVYAELDLTNANAENAPAGTKIFFRINAEDLVLNPQTGYVYQTLQYQTTVDADGMYEISLPTATHQAVTVTVQADQFNADQTQGVDLVKNIVFYSTASSIGLQDSETHYMDISYQSGMAF